MANVKCPQCKNLITGVSAGQTIKCPKCGKTMKLAGNTNSVSNTAQANNVQMDEIKEDSTVKGLGIALIVIGIIGILMGMMMFGDIGIACLVGAITALLSGIAFLKVASAIKKLKRGNL